MNILIVDSHEIYRRGLVASLELIDGVARVEQADRVPDAGRGARFEHDVVIVDPSIAGAAQFIATTCATTAARVVVCAPDCDESAIRAALDAGVAGYLRKDTLTQELLGAALKAAASGAIVVPQSVLHAGLARPERVPPTPLNDREQRVLTLIADGYPTREVATELCYSERTVKNVLHDVVTKLNARSRSHAVAHAVREGLI